GGGRGRRHRRVARTARVGGRPPHQGGVHGRRIVDVAGTNEVAGGVAGGPTSRVADGPVPPTVGVPRRGRRRAPQLTGPPEPLVQPHRLLPAAGLRRYARPLPHRTTVETAGGTAA